MFDKYLKILKPYIYIHTHINNYFKAKFLSFMFTCLIFFFCSPSCFAEESWEMKSSMSIPRTDFASVVYNNKVYCIGGYNSGYSNALEVYDPINDKWEIKTSILTARRYAHAFLVEDKIYLIGGETTGAKFAADIEVYDIRNDSWSIASTITSDAISDITSGTIYPEYFRAIENDKIIYLWYTFSINDTYFYAWDIENDVWTKSADKKSFWRTEGILVDNKIYFVGGRSGLAHNKVLRYDIESDIWQYMNNMNTARIATNLLEDGEKIYALGGMAWCGDGHGYNISDSEYYDLNTNKWITLPSLSISRSNSYSIKLGNYIYVIGGRFSKHVDAVRASEEIVNGVLKSVEVYNLTDNSLSSISDMKVARENFAVIVIDGTIYCIGGDSSGTVESYKTTISPDMLVAQAENSKTFNDINNARAAVNNMEESIEKDQLQERLNSLYALEIEITPLMRKKPSQTRLFNSRDRRHLCI